MLDATTIHLWLIDAEDPGVRAACDLGWLSRSETGCMRACPGVRECTRYAVGRCLVRRLIGDIRQCPPSEVVLDESPEGSGALVPGLGRVAWAECERWITVALTGNNPIALEISPRETPVAYWRLRTAIASRTEARWLDSLPRRERPAALARIRALKVAWLRASSAGSAVKLSRLDVVDAQGHCVDSVREANRRWFLAEPPAALDEPGLAVVGGLPEFSNVPRIVREVFASASDDRHHARPAETRETAPVT